MPKLKRGEERDGLVFWCYRVDGVERWLSPDAFAAKKKSQAKYTDEYWKANKPRLSAKGKERWAVKGKIPAVKEAALKRAREWLANNKERNRENCARRYAERKEEFLEYCRAYYQANADKVKARTARWSKNNPSKVHNYSVSARRKRRLAIEQTEHPVTASELDIIAKAAKGRCHYCGMKRKLTFDHIVPLARGGSHSKCNIVMACKPCNCSKNARDPHAYAAKLGRLLI